MGQAERSDQPQTDVALESEHWSGIAMKAFERIGQLWVDNSFTSLDHYKGLVAEDIEASQFRANLQTALQQQNLQIQVDRSRHALQSMDRTALLDAWQALFADHSATSHKKVKFKIDAVQHAANALETDVRIRFDSHAADGSHQQLNLRWDCGWHIQGNDVTLVRIQQFDLEVIRTYERPVWSDVTLSAVGGTAAFQQQLQYGLDHWLDRMEQGVEILTTGYQGIAVADVNNDGLEDVFVPQPGGVLSGLPNRLFLQNADGTVRDVAAEYGVDWLNESHSGLFVDLDNDGDQDLIVATSFGLVFTENINGRQLKARLTKLIPEAPPMSLAAADYDLDGQLDIYVCCYSPRQSSQLLGRPLPYHDANNGGRNLLLRNLGNWSFQNVTIRSGLDQNNRRFSFAAVWEDFDNDGDPDLYVANDYGRNNLFVNDGGQFRDVAESFAVEDISAGMSVAVGDANADGWFDIYVSNMWSSAGNRIAYQKNFLSEQDSSLQQQYQRHARGNSLFLNQLSSKQPFADVSQMARVTMGRWAWSSQFADINNDGWDDLLVANGFVTQERKDDL
ncbi:MAG: VCBS repeat-containing protein [Pirellulaceae bacterium]